MPEPHARQSVRPETPSAILATGIAVVRACPGGNDGRSTGDSVDRGDSASSETMDELDGLLKQHRETHCETAEAIVSRQQPTALPSFFGDERAATAGTMC